MSERDDRLQSILVVYIEAAEAGRAPSREELLARHPEFAAELAEFLDGRQRIERAAAPLYPAAQSPSETATVAPSEGRTAAPLGKVRYFGDYELLSEIARGGMGVVYKARQVSLDRIVALKMILGGQLASADDVRRFHQEANAAANLDHPNIVPIYEVGEHDGQHYFSMKFIDGGSLAGGKPGQRRAAELLVKVAQAVHHAHQRGILHRDLKPSNILIDGRGEPQVTDFGLARRIQGDNKLTQSGAIVGTPSYMAPEQASGQKGLSVSCDVYALGAVLYELLTGRPPFRADSPLDTLLQVLEREPEPPRRSEPAIDRDLETICLKCLQKEPHRRYASAEALAEDLRRWLAGEPIEARPVGRTERAVKWVRRNPVVAVLLAAVVLTLAGGVAGIWWKYLDAKEQEGIASTRAREAREESAAKDAALIHIDGLRLVAESSARLPRDPGLALLLALEGADRGRPRLAAHNNALLAALFASRERRTLSGDRVLDAFRGPEAQRTGGFVFRSAQVSADGRRVLTVGIGLESTADLRQTAQVWDAASGRLLCLLRLPHMDLKAVRLSPDGHRVVTAFHGLLELQYADGSRCLYNGSAAHVWDADSGKHVAVLRGHTDDISVVSFSPDSQKVATISADETVRIWDADSGKQFARIQPGSTFSPPWRSFPASASFSADGKCLLILSTETARRIHWEPSAGNLPTNVNPPLRSDKPTAEINRSRGLSPGTLRAEEKDPPARIFEVASGKLLATLTLGEPRAGRSEATTVAVFSPDGNRVVTPSGQYSGNPPMDWGTELILWNAHDGKRVGKLETHHEKMPGHVQALGFSADGERLLVVYQGVAARHPRSSQLLEVLHVPTGEVIARRSLATEEPDGTNNGRGRKVRSAQFSSDGRHVLLLLGDAFFIGNKLWRWDRMPGPGSGAKVVLEPPEDPTAHLWNVDTGEESLLSGHGNDLSSACFSVDGRWIVTASVDGTARVWVVVRGSDVVQVLRGHPGLVGTASFSRDGQRIVTARGFAPSPPRSDEDPTVRLWDASSGRGLAVLKGLEGMQAPWRDRVLGPVVSAAFSNDGRRMLTVSHDPNARIRSEKGKEDTVPFTPVRLWDADTGKELHAFAGLSEQVLSAAFSPDGQSVLTVSSGIQNWALFHGGNAEGGFKQTDQDGVRIWDTATGRLLHALKKTTGTASAAAWSPDGKRVCLAGKGAGEIWDAATGQRLLALDAEDVAVVVWSPDGRLVLGFPHLFRDDRKYIHVWDAATGKKVCVLQGHEDEVAAATFSPDSRRIVTASKDGTARIWSAADGEEVVVLRGHEGPVHWAAWSPDGKRVATASEDRTARVWDADSGREWFTLTGHEGPVYSAVFSPTGDRVLTASADGTARIWPADPLPLARERKSRELTAAERKRFLLGPP
jgi:WD40 repeat protein